jgi:hypothetical protein
MMHMEDPGSTGKALTFEQLAALREQTEGISQFLHHQLTIHLEAFRPLLAPRRLSEKYVGAKETVVRAEKVLAQLQERFKQVCGKPFALPPELDEQPLARLDNRLEVSPWEYAHEAKSARESKTVTITAPVRWVLTYNSGHTLVQVRQILGGKRNVDQMTCVSLWSMRWFGSAGTTGRDGFRFSKVLSRIGL